MYPAVAAVLADDRPADADPDGYIIVHWHHPDADRHHGYHGILGRWEDWQSIGYAGGGSPV
ncbi:MAG: hypothetical protein R3F53_14960 [Gammaproteobacteria bacterium]